MVAGVILIGSLLPLPPSGEKPLVPVSAADTVVHVVSYAVLGYVLTGTLKAETRRVTGHRTGGTTGGRLDSPFAVGTLAVVLAAGYGLGVEGLQTLVPGRHFEVTDSLANATGAILGAVVWGVVERYRIAGVPEAGQSDRSP